MTSLFWLIPVALFLGGLALAGFIWALKIRAVRRPRRRGLSGARRRTARAEGVASEALNGYWPNPAYCFAPSCNGALQRGLCRARI